VVQRLDIPPLHSATRSFAINKLYHSCRVYAELAWAQDYKVAQSCWQLYQFFRHKIYKSFCGEKHDTKQKQR